MPPGEVAISAALLLVTGPVLVGVEGEASMLLVVGLGLTGGVEEESFDVFLDFEGACAAYFSGSRGGRRRLRREQGRPGLDRD